MNEQSANPPVLAVGRHAWEDVLQLLTSGQYESAASLLEETESATASEVDPTLTTILKATRQLCLAGTDFQAEAEFHREAFHTATARELALREHLQVLLNLIFLRTHMPGQTATIAASLHSSAKVIEQKRDVPGLLKRLQSLLGRSADTFSAAAGPADPDSAIGAVHEQPVVAESTVPWLAFYCLGPFSVYQNDRQISEWNGLKGLKILKYLVAQGGKPVAKDVLMEVLWPDGDPEAVRRNLHQAIYSLRQTLRRDEPDFQHIPFQHDAYHFNSAMSIWIDFVQFERYLQAGQQHEVAGRIDEAMDAYGIAEELYQGDFLEDDPYEDWAVGQRELLRSSYLRIADRLAANLVERKEYTAATVVAQKALTHDPYYEAAHRRLMQCYIAQRQRHLAVRQYHTCARLLADELDLTPAAETVELYRQLTGGD